MTHKQLPILKIENLTKKFIEKNKTFTALDNISFNLMPGEILGFLGPNGAGKTTTIQILLSTLSPTSGSIHYFNKNLLTHRSEILQHIGFASSYVNLPYHLTIEENLKIQGLLYGIHGKPLTEAIEHFLTQFKLLELRKKQVGNLSAGQKTRVMLAKAFISKPKIILLDEPTASLDPDIAEQIRNFILEQQKTEQISVLFTSHNMEEVATICDRIIVLKEGKIIANETPEKLASSIATAHLQLHINNEIEKTIHFATEHKLCYSTKENYIEIAIDEQKIAEFLTTLAHNNIKYSHISIEKPTLEDYFIHIAKNSK